MPGTIDRLTVERAVGRASHPTQNGYAVTLHVIQRALVVRSVVVDPVNGFDIPLADLTLQPDDLQTLGFLIAETDEWITARLKVVPSESPLRVEDILCQHVRRRWINGATYRDAVRAGLSAETMIDMFFRDLLGRSADPHGLKHYTESLRDGTMSYDDVRASLLGSDEYRMRRKYAVDAPGAIFSQKLLLRAASRDFAKPQPDVPVQVVPAAELVALDGEAFVSACYRRILLKEVDEAGLAHYLYCLYKGTTKLQILRGLANDPTAVTAGVRLTGLAELEAEAAREEATAEA
jgi:hypothetical protein